MKILSGISENIHIGNLTKLIDQCLKKSDFFKLIQFLTALIPWFPIWKTKLESVNQTTDRIVMFQVLRFLVLS